MSKRRRARTASSSETFRTILRLIQDHEQENNVKKNYRHSPFHGMYPIRATHKPERPAAAMLVLVPGQLGSMHLFERKQAGPLRHGGLIDDPSDVLDAVHSANHTTVVLCGSKHAKPIVDVVDTIADVFIVPLHWLRSVPRDQPRARAALAARLVTAKRRRPIEHVVRGHQLSFLF